MRVGKCALSPQVAEVDLCSKKGGRVKARKETRILAGDISYGNGMPESGQSLLSRPGEGLKKHSAKRAGRVNGKDNLRPQASPLTMLYYPK